MSKFIVGFAFGLIITCSWAIASVEEFPAKASLYIVILISAVSLAVIGIK